MQSDKTRPILEQYLAYLLTIKGRSRNTILEYRMDLLQFFRYVTNQRGIAESGFHFADVDYIRSINCLICTALSLIIRKHFIIHRVHGVEDRVDPAILEVSQIKSSYH